MNKEKQIFSLVLTGGPCGGKSTITANIVHALTQIGWTVYVVPEAATQYFTAGVKIDPQDGISMYEFQQAIIADMISREEIFKKLAQQNKHNKVMIVFDRGILDNAVYCTTEQFTDLLEQYNLKLNQVNARYDMVMHLVTAAKGAHEFYSLESNQTRTETPEQATILDDKSIEVWTSHPHFRVIKNKKDFEEKKRDAVNEVLHALGAPEKHEIEKKYLIRRPDLRSLQKIHHMYRSPIVQTYLSSTNTSLMERVRTRGDELNGVIYFHTIKQFVAPGINLETEKLLERPDYRDLLERADPKYMPIKKNRYCFVHDAQFFELDIFLNLPKTSILKPDEALLELEVKYLDEFIHFPPGIEIIADVTNDLRYSNRSLAFRG